MSSAFVIYFFAIMFISTTLVWILLSQFVNEFTVVINDLIIQGMMTSIFVQYFVFVVDVFGVIPFIVFISLIIWSFVRLIEEKEVGT